MYLLFFVIPRFYGRRIRRGAWSCAPLAGFAARLLPPSAATLADPPRALLGGKAWESADDASIDPYLVAARMTDDAVLAYHTALEFYGRAYSDFSELQYLTKRATRSVTFHDWRFHPVLLLKALLDTDSTHFGIEHHDRDGQTVDVISLDRALADVLNRSAILDIVQNGVFIADYPADKPYPSCLLLGLDGSDPVHIVVGREADAKRCIVITVYRPDPAKWSDDFKERRTSLNVQSARPAISEKAPPR